MYYDQLVKEYGGSIYRVALSRLGNSDVAQDVVQQVFLLLFEKKPQFSCREQLKTWLIRCAVMIAANERKRYDNSKTEPLDEHTHLSVSDSSAVELYDMLSVLPETLRDVVVLYYIEDMQTADIAKCLGINRGAVRTRLTRARKVLSQMYKEEL